MIELLIFLLGIGAGHYISPWIDERVADYIEWRDPDPSDERNANRNDWS